MNNWYHKNSRKENWRTLKNINFRERGGKRRVELQKTRNLSSRHRATNKLDQARSNLITALCSSNLVDQNPAGSSLGLMKAKAYLPKA